MADDHPMESDPSAREGQALAESIVDTVREPLVVLDERFRVISVNRSFCQSFDVSPEEARGRLLYDLGGGQWDKPALRRLEASLRDGNDVGDLELEFYRPGSSPRTVRLNARRLSPPGHDDAMILLSIEDLTERQRAEAAAQLSQKLLSTTLRSIGDAVIATDTQGRITFMNPVAEQLTGWSEAGALGRDHTDVFRIVSEDTRELAESPVDKVIRHGTISGLANHTLLVARDGTEYSIDDSGAPIRDESGDLWGVVLVFRDITERRAAQAQLQAAYERERRIAEALQRPLTLEVAEGAFPGLSVVALYAAVLGEAHVGGDFFDAFALPRGLVAVAVSDASGKGLSAAVRTMQVKDVLRAFACEYPHSAAAIVARLNDYVCDAHRFEEDGDDFFSCLALAILDSATGEGALVSAGCEPPRLVRADGTLESFETGGLPLGVRRQEIYTVRPLRLAPGDTLVLMTDGIPEARRGEEFLGDEGVAALLKAAFVQGRPSLRDTADAILEGARAFAGALRDDACLVLVRRR